MFILKSILYRYEGKIKKIQYVPSLFNVHIAYFPYISVIFVASTRLNMFLPYNKICDKILKTNYKHTLCL